MALTDIKNARVVRAPAININRDDCTHSSAGIMHLQDGLLDKGWIRSSIIQRVHKHWLCPCISNRIGSSNKSHCRSNDRISRANPQRFQPEMKSCCPRAQGNSVPNADKVGDFSFERVNFRPQGGNPTRLDGTHDGLFLGLSHVRRRKINTLLLGYHFSAKTSSGLLEVAFNRMIFGWEEGSGVSVSESKSSCSFSPERRPV